jgi:2-methylcitrate dehydratase PrpD
MNSSYTRVLVKYVMETTFDKFPKQVIQQAKRIVIDFIACALGGYATKYGKWLVDYAKDLGGGKQLSTIIGSGDKVAWPKAAFVNGALSGILDYDENYLGLDELERPRGHAHPGPTVVSAALAAAECSRASGKDLITSIVLGYEVLTRVCNAKFPSPQRYNQVYGLATHSVFGAVAATGKLLRLNEQEMFDAFGLAGQFAPLPCMWKSVINPLGASTAKYLRYAWASEAGIHAALLAKRGFYGPREILDGDKGFWLIAGSDKCDWDRLTEGLGEKYEILAVDFKAWPVCRFVFPAIDGALSIVKENKIEPWEIEKIIVRGAPSITNPPYDNYEPKNDQEAEFSIPYPLALALYGIASGPEWYADETLKDTKILDLARKVQLVPDPEAEKKSGLYLGSGTTSIEIVAKGKRFAKVRDMRTTITDAELTEKFKRQARYCLTEKKIEDILRLLNNLESIDEVAAFTELLH